jgi:predicted amidohydrolase
VERDGDRVYNSAILLDPKGQILLHHRKINELEIGHPFYALGDRLNVSRTPLGTFGLMICADGFAGGQVISRSLALMSADVIHSTVSITRLSVGLTSAALYLSPPHHQSPWLARQSR